MDDNCRTRRPPLPPQLRHRPCRRRGATTLFMIVLISWCSWLWLLPASQANTIVGLHVAPFNVRQTATSSAHGQQQQLAKTVAKGSIEGEESGNAIHNQQQQSSSSAGTPVAPISLKPDLSGLISEVAVDCNSADIRITLQSAAAHPFNGMIYPKGLSKNSSCMAEYSTGAAANFTYVLPLRACNTMSTEVTDGVEYFNTVIVQPHRRLVTNQGRGYHIRCRYQTREKRIANTAFNVSMSSLNREGAEAGGLGSANLTATAPMPTSSMKIFITESSGSHHHHGGSHNHLDQSAAAAENVKIGDKLSLSISIEEQEIYGMKVTNCLVRDGLNWGEQPLINDDGCPVDREIMGPFEYAGNLTRAQVTFHAHKFPYTSSVYYQCNVRLCLKEGGGCDDVPPSCDRNGRNYRSPNARSRRNTVGYDAVVVPTTGASQYPNLASALASRLASQKGDKDMSMEVYSGLYVDESENTKKGGGGGGRSEGDGDDDLDEDLDDVNSPIRKRPSESEEFCISMRKFAIGVAIASLLLMFAVVLLVICVLQRRRRRNHHRRLFGSSGSTIGSGSVYSGGGGGGPYSNRAFSRD